MQMFTNPLSQDGLRPDPFILRYNGRYYLYVTHPRILCWSSSDFIEWTAEGPVIEENSFGTLVPFAPEVIYFNGWFFLYTSPSGRGHCVLRSKSPLGPFTLVADGLERNLDGSPFIDDDGSWYLYWADDRGILGCRTTDGVQMHETILVCPTKMGWTEGPQVTKEAGLYYLTYCGNHYLSKGYRVYSAVSKHPLGPFIPCSDEPLLVQTEGKTVGLGHCSVVWGPDLLVRYMAYHNLNEDASRDFNIAPIFLQHGRTTILGPCTYEQPLPNLPAYSTHPAGGENAIEWVPMIGGEGPIPDTFLSQTGHIEVVSSQLFVTERAVVEVNLTSEVFPCGVFVGGYRIDCRSETELSITYPDGSTRSVLIPMVLATGVLHSFTLRKEMQRVQVFLDGLKLFSGSCNNPIHGSVGCFGSGTALSIGHAQVSIGSVEEAFASLPRPIPARILQGEDGLLNIPSAGTYLVHTTQECEGGTTSISTQQYYLKKGIQFLNHAGKGTLVIHKKAEQLSACSQWSPKGSYGKYLIGDAGMSGTDVVARIKRNQMAQGGSFGVVFRVSDPSEGGEGDDSVLGIDFFKGYSLMVASSHVILYKHGYNARILAQTGHAFSLGKGLEIRILAVGHTFEVFVERQSILRYLDNDHPYLYGKVGIRHMAALIDTAEISVSCLD